MLEEKLARARFVVVISDYERRLLAGRYPRLQDAMHVVHCGIDLDGFPRRPGPAGPPEPAGPTSLLCIASLNGYKGHPVLLQACAELRRRGRSLRCTLVGDGPDRAGLEASARRLGIADAVRFTGFLAAPEVRRLLLESDIVVQPSVVVAGGKMEGIPVALMEALAARRPVVASARSGVPELVRDGETGLLVPPGDAEALATAIGRLLDDPALRDRLGRAGRDLVEQQFDVTVSARRLATLLTAPPPEGRGAQATTVSDGSDV
jgi:glycosyltransferase involved in cell wall biosynthesis